MTLWAWEQREDLRFIDPEHFAVAYLAAALTLSGGEVILAPRGEPLLLPPHTRMIVVVRIEDDRHDPPARTSAQVAKCASLIAQFAANRSAIQIDYDATRSERKFYRELLATLRERIPAATELSITALASWCLDDGWLDGLPIDEAVPMLYRMGRDRAAALGRFRDGAIGQRCRGSVGLSLDEPYPNLAGGKRVYLFAAKPWTASQLQVAREELAP